MNDRAPAIHSASSSGEREPASDPGLQSARGRQLNLERLHEASDAQHFLARST